MTCSRSLTTIVTLALITACGEQPSDIQPDDLAAAQARTSPTRMVSIARSELLAHMPDAAPTATLLVSPPDYTQLKSASVQGSGGSMHLTIHSGGGIPRHPDPFMHSVAVFGYAWVDLNTGKGIVAVIHPAIGRDSKQNPDGWHTHPVQLAAGTLATGGTSDFCIVSIGRSQAGIAIQADELRVNISVQWAGLGADALDVAASFIVQPDAGCSASGLGVDVLSTESL